MEDDEPHHMRGTCGLSARPSLRVGLQPLRLGALRLADNLGLDPKMVQQTPKNIVLFVSSNPYLGLDETFLLTNILSRCLTYIGKQIANATDSRST